ncbi:CusA/CzcA family heavy metal efflux RND transporter [Pendulispora brunnea]|uniref:CusA/CzcA family heavy metal efflux RND transporter n=1 Tax=Pendulispora brunnea TaxID=2905690 RepID=A0ABZ2KB41_9BACT
MFAWLARLGVQRAWFVLLAAALFTVAGIFAFQSLPIQAFPDVTDPQVDVVGVYPGQSAEEVEKRVTLELERVLSGTPSLIGLRSVSVFGLALVTLTFDDARTDFELRTLVAERLREANLPESASADMGPQSTPVGQIYRYTLRGPRSLKDLRAINDFVVERRLRAVQGVAEVWTFGGFERQYQARIDPGRLAAAGVSLKEVYDALARTNANAGGGYVGLGSQEFIVRGLGAVLSPVDIGLAEVREVDGVPVRIGDVADIVEGSTPRRGAVGRGHEDEVVEGIVMLRRGENPDRVLKALRARIEELQRDVLPKDVTIDTFYDRTSLLEATLATVGRNMSEGALLVVFVLYLFLRTARGTLIVAVVIPLSLFAAFIGLRLMGLPANLISLGAIDFGILVDGAVIVLEASLHTMSTHPHALDREEKKMLIERAADSVAGPVGFSMLIIIVALIPIFALERTEGRIFAPMAYTYAFALIGALACGTFVVPALETVLLPNRAPPAEARWLLAIRAAFLQILDLAARRKRLVLAGGFATLLAIGLYAKGIGSEFLPELNEGGFYITTTFPSTISLDEVKHPTADMRERILKFPEVADVLSHIGRPEKATQAEGSFNVEFFVKLWPESKWPKGMTRAKLEEQLRRSLADIPGAHHNFSQPITDRVFETISGIIGQVVIKVHGEDLDKTTALAHDIVARLASVKGVADLSVYQAGDIPQLQIELDRNAVARRGLSIGDVQDTLAVALGGQPATQVWEGERRYDVALRLPDVVRGSPDALGRLLVGPPERSSALSEVAAIRYGSGHTAIWREDFSRFVAIKFNVRGRDLGSTVEEAKRAIRDIQVPDETYLSWSGEFKNKERAMKRLGLTVPLALFAVFGILYAHFRRVRPALLIMGALPFGITGAIAGLRFMGENFSVSGAVGCVALLGQMVLAVVLLLTRIEEAELQGEANPIVEGTKTAFRPVLLTTSLAVLGLTPSALSHAMGSETQRPFAIAILAGLIVGIPMVMLLVPLAYAVTKGGRWHAALVAGVAALLLGAPSAHAQGPAPVITVPETDAPHGFTLEQTLAALKVGHPLLTAAKANVRAAESQATAAGLWTNPQLDAGYTRSLGTTSFDRFGYGTAGITQFVEVAGAPKARRRAAEAEMRATEADGAGVARRLAFDAEEAYIGLAAQISRRGVAEETVRDLERADRIVRARVGAGMAPQYDASRIAIALASARAELGEAEAQIARARGDLATAVGPAFATLRGDPVYDFDATPPLPNLPELQRDLLSHRTDLRAAQHRAESARLDIETAQRSVFPGFGVRIGAGYGQAPNQTDLGVGIVLPIPLVDRGQGIVPAARARADANEALADAIVIAARERLTASHAELVRRRETLEKYRTETRQISMNMRSEAEAGYREARLSVLELVDAYQSFHDARLKMIDLASSASLAEVGVRRVLEGAQ